MRDPNLEELFEADRWARETARQCLEKTIDGSTTNQGGDGLMQTVITFILLISVLVFIHELGHFIFAKRAGILVREFAIGFGPKLISWFKGETQYSIRILPLGGYVRMAGGSGKLSN